MIDLEIKRNQITRRFQSDDAAHVSIAGVKVCQIEQVLLRQRPGGFSQRIADRRVQAGIGNGYFLRPDGFRESCQGQQG